MEENENLKKEKQLQKNGSSLVLKPSLESEIPQNKTAFEQIDEMKDCFQYLSIRNERFQQENWNLILHFVQSLKTQFLELCQNNQSQIIISICHVSFTNLQSIDLSDNRILNLEPLAFLDAPQLQNLDVCNNEFTSIKPFDKMKFDQIKLMQVNVSSKFNFFNESSINRIKTAKKFQVYRNRSYNWIQTTQAVNVGIYAKFEAEQFEQISIIPIIQRLGVKCKIKQALIRKYHEAVQKIKFFALTQQEYIRSNYPGLMDQ